MQVQAAGTTVCIAPANQPHAILYPPKSERGHYHSSRRRSIVPDAAKLAFATEQAQQGPTQAAKVASVNGAGPWRATMVPRIQPAHLMNYIKGAASWQELVELHRGWYHCMNHVHVSAMLTHLAQLKGRQQQQQQHASMQPSIAEGHGSVQDSASGPPSKLPLNGPATAAQGSRRSARNSSSLKPSQLSNEELLVQALLQFMVMNMHTFENRQIANCMWAVAKLGVAVPPPWVQRCMAMARHTLHNATGQQLANIGYAVALRPEWLDSMSARERVPWLRHYFKTCRHSLHQLRPQELSNLLWAAATLHLHKPLPDCPHVHKCVVGALEHTSRQASRLNAQEVSMVLWSAGKLSGQQGMAVGLTTTPLPRARMTSPVGQVLRQLLVRLHEVAHQVQPQGLSQVMLALADLNARPPRAWARALLEATAPTLRRCRGQELANVVLGLAYLGYGPPEEWWVEWQQCAHSRLRSFSSQELANSVWGMCRLKYQPSSRFMAEFLMVTVQQLPSFQPQELSMLIQGIAQLRFKPDTAWMHLFYATVHERLPSLRPEALAIILWSCVRLRSPPPQAWLQGVVDAVKQHLPHMKPQSLAMVVASLAAWGVLPDAAWCKEFMETSQKQLDKANVCDVATVLWGIAVLDMQPSAQWVQSCMHRCMHLLQVQVLAQQEVEQQAQILGGNAPQGEQQQGEQSLLAPSAVAVMTKHEVATHQGEGLPAMVHAGPVKSFRDFRDVSRRGGRLKDRKRVLAATRMWGGATLTRVIWALARLGYPASHPLVQPFLATAGQLELGWVSWQVRRRVYYEKDKATEALELLRTGRQRNQVQMRPALGQQQQQQKQAKQHDGSVEDLSHAEQHLRSRRDASEQVGHTAGSEGMQHSSSTLQIAAQVDAIEGNAAGNMEGAQVDGIEGVTAGKMDRAGRSTGEVGALTAKHLEYLVLEGMLDWSLSKLGDASRTGRAHRSTRHLVS